MNSKTRIISLLDETTVLFLEHCKQPSTGAMGSIMLSLARLDELIKGEPLPKAESQATGSFHDRNYLLGEEAAEYIHSMVTPTNDYNLLALYRVNEYNLPNTEAPKIIVTIDGDIYEAVVHAIFVDKHTKKTVAGFCYNHPDCEYGRVDIDTLDAVSLCAIADQIKAIIDHPNELVAMEPVIDFTTLPAPVQQALAEAERFISGFEYDETQDVKPLLALLRQFEILDTTMSNLTKEQSAELLGLPKGVVIDEWSSKDIGDEVYKHIITSYLANDLQVTRLLCQALTIDHIKQAHEYFSGNDLLAAPTKERAQQIRAEFIECFNDYCNDK